MDALRIVLLVKRVVVVVVVVQGRKRIRLEEVVRWDKEIMEAQLLVKPPHLMELEEVEGQELWEVMPLLL